MFHCCRAMLLAKQDAADFEEESKQALHEALVGVSEVKLHVEDARDLQGINYIKQVSREWGSRSIENKVWKETNRSLSSTHLRLPQVTSGHLSQALTCSLPPQGNADLYTEEAIRQRHDLRTRQAVIDAVKSWWR